MVRSLKLRALASVICALTLLGHTREAFAGPPAWTAVNGSLGIGRQIVSSVVLQDGRVLLFGGSADNGESTATDVYDPASNTFSPAAPMHVARVLPAFARLLDGRVLVAGGQFGGASVEIYDPATNTWTSVAPMLVPIAFAAAATLPDGRVMVVGGASNGTIVDSTYIYSPGSDTWVAGPSLSTARYAPVVVTLAAGRVLAIGGADASGTQAQTSAEIYDAASNTWASAGAMSTGRLLSSAGVLPDGRVIVVGGLMISGSIPVSAVTDIYDPATNQWSQAASMSTGRYLPVAGVIAGGRFIVAGGLTGDANSTAVLSTSEAYDPVLDVWVAGAPMSTPRAGAGGAVVNGSLLAAGGETGNGAAASGEILLATNHAPTAAASAVSPAQGTAGWLTAVPVSAAGSSDADGDALTFRWSEGATTLVETTSASTFVALGLGTHTLTLTVRDAWGGSATASVTVDVTDANAALTTQIAALQSQVTSLTAQNTSLQSQVSTLTTQNAALQSQVALLQAQLSACLAGGGGDSAIIAAVNLVTATLRAEFKDPSFTVPGATPQAQFDAILRAMLGRHDSLENLYAALKPKKGPKREDRNDRDDRKGRGDRH